MQPDRPLSRLKRFFRPTYPPLPADFLFGTGTSDHQCEAFDPRFPDVWDAWEAAHPGDPNQPAYVARGRATDFWNRYPEDVGLAASLGCAAFRFSIAWARVEPEPGRFSDEALAHYRGLVDAICAAGMEPVVTLMHFVWPQHVEDRGGLRAPEFPRWFGDYAARVRDALSERVRYWITINEPNALIFGYIKPFWMERYVWPPGLPLSADDAESMRAGAEVIRNLFLANRAARLALRSGPGGERRLVSANSYYLGLPNRLWRLPVPLMRLVDWRARSEKGWSEENWELLEGRFVLRRPGRDSLRPPPAGPLSLLRRLGSLAPLEAAGELLKSAAGLAGQAKTFAVLFSFVGANWWHLGQRGDLPTFLCPSECRGQQDYVAFDYYFGTPFLHQAGRLLDVLERRYDRSPIWPDGLYDALTYYRGLFPGLPIFIIENGMAGPPDTTARARYLRDHIRQVQCARAHGVPIVGYLAWSLTTNREWGLPAEPVGDFGLFHIDLDRDPALTRQPTPASRAYATIIARRSG